MAMYLRFTAVLMAVAAVIDLGRAIPATPAEVQCGDNAVFKTSGSRCSPTCENPIPADNRLQKCEPGCFCMDGFVKNSKGECVRPKDCDVETSKCPANEEFKKCGSACAPTCANPLPPAVCIKKCVVGCFCKEGFLRDHRGQCVEQRECLTEDKPAQTDDSRKCPENEVFHPCGTACPPTCENPSILGTCTKQCVIGCFCKEGHLRNAMGICVPASNCAASTTMDMTAAIVHSDPQCSDSDREIYSRCGTHLDCMASCDVLAHHHSIITGRLLPPKCMQRMCKPACVCKMPYFRHANGQCVEVKECNRP